MNYSEEIIKKDSLSSVLVVDDSEIILKLVRNYLKMDNYKVTTAENGKVALEYLSGNFTFDLVVLDVMLPDISGFEICRIMRKRYSLYELPVLFLTGLKEIMSIVEGFSAGGNDYLVKPFNSQEFMVRAQTLIKLKKLTQTNEALQEAVEIKNRALVQLQHEIAYRIRIEKELTFAKETADEANKLKTLFLANMSHEIRTPMNAILGFSEILKNRVTDEKSKGFIDSVIASGKNLLVVINDLLDLSKIEAGKIDLEPEPVNIRVMIDEIGQIFELKLSEKRNKFDSNVSDKIPQYLDLDETRIRQILLNLVGNAIKFTNRGKVEVQVVADSFNKINKTVNLNIIISDTGIGIASDQIEAIFEAFTQQHGQSRKAFGGTGLGLTITKRLVEMMGGLIRVESEVGQGSTFSVYLPDVPYFEEGFESSKIIEEHQLGILNFEPRNVLIIDDIVEDIEVISEYLDSTGLRIFKLSDAKSLSDFFETTKPDLIIVDLRMPEVDGYEVKNMIRANPDYHNIPIIAITAHAMKGDKEKVINDGFDSHLLKPIKRTDLLIEIMKYLPYTTNEGKKVTVSKDKINKSTETNYNISHEFECELTELYNTDFANLIKSYRIGLIKEFANKLNIIAEKYKAEFLKSLVSKLHSECENLDMIGLKKTLSSFIDIMDKFQNF